MERLRLCGCCLLKREEEERRKVSQSKVGQSSQGLPKGEGLGLPGYCQVKYQEDYKTGWRVGVGSFFAPSASGLHKEAASQCQPTS